MCGSGVRCVFFFFFFVFVFFFQAEDGIRDKLVTGVQTCALPIYMKGPFVLPNNIKENDYIELGQLGAYGLTFRTQFNGFYSDEIYEVEDKPIMTMYDKGTNKEFLVA